MTYWSRSNSDRDLTPSLTWSAGDRLRHQLSSCMVTLFESRCRSEIGVLDDPYLLNVSAATSSFVQRIVQFSCQR